MLAVQNGYTSIAQILLKSGAEINARDIKMTTALAMAKNSGHKELAKLLRDAGGVVFTPARIVYIPPPIYPGIAKGRNWQGIVEYNDSNMNNFAEEISLR